MHPYFRGWKRKLGVVTLMIACAFAGLWMNGITNIGASAPVGRGTSYRATLTPEGICLTTIRIHPRPAETLVTVIPYIPIFIPLTLLSAWLLLSKPRLAKSRLIQS